MNEKNYCIKGDLIAKHFLEIRRGKNGNKKSSPRPFFGHKQIFSFGLIKVLVSISFHFWTIRSYRRCPNTLGIFWLNRFLITDVFHTFWCHSAPRFSKNSFKRCKYNMSFDSPLNRVPIIAGVTPTIILFTF